MKGRTSVLALALAGLVVVYLLDLPQRRSTADEVAAIVSADHRDAVPPGNVALNSAPKGYVSQRALTPAQADPFHPVLPAPPTTSVNPPPPVPPPPAMHAPPVTYRYFGRVAGPDGKIQVYLMKDNLLFPIAEGVTLDDQYRVDAIGQNEVRLTYLPLGTPQSIPVPAE